jgi:hypothetical protein
MKSATKYILLLLLAGGTMVFAGGGLECGDCGAPPHGIGLVGNATGTKLDGVITIEFYNIVTTGSLAGQADTRLVLRLRKGKTFAVFYDETSVSDYTNPAIVQAAITGTMTQPILDEFFSGAQLTVRLKSIDSFGQLDTGLLGTTVPSTRSVFVLANLELAVQ